MLHLSPIAIFHLLLVCSPPLLYNSSIFGSEWAGVMAGVASEFKTELIVSIEDYELRTSCWTSSYVPPQSAN
ncbi:hypothetical protein B9Z19DRAFT_1123247 [Tuber borchii]|uniref:Secreted protein n=1 Tax=Tuber borchii TaxID=42251 RepID=A0A2T6ZYT4_TUBBO|nr:hypothetical protein B9Z19DRAFT_1123247 [Tuber borchii]